MPALRCPVRQSYDPAVDAYVMVDRTGRACSRPSRKPFAGLPLSAGGARMASARVAVAMGRL